MKGPKRIQLNQLGRPADGNPICELRFTNKDGQTEVWMIRTDTLDFEGLSSPTRVRVAYLDEGVDVRLGNQQASIDRLLKHLDHHHVDLTVYNKDAEYRCDYKEPDAAAEA